MTTRLLFLFFVCGLSLAHSGELTQLETLCSRKYWIDREKNLPAVTGDILDESIEAVRVYYLNQQLPDGNFRYGLDLTDNTEDSDDNMVRQAGALWGLANLNRDRFTEATRRSLLLGLDFYMRNQRPVASAKTTVVTYRGQERIKTGMVALYCLALVDFLEGQEQYLSDEKMAPYIQSLGDNLAFLRYLELPDGSWRSEYRKDAEPTPETPGESSPYFDGEALLCYLRAEQYARNRPLVSRALPPGLTARIEEALPKLLKKYAVDAFEATGDQALTKGFYQWGSMSCAVYCSTPGRPHADIAVKAALALAWWQIYGNHLEYREGNTGYAVEGLTAAYLIAMRAGRQEDAGIIRAYVLKIMSRLLTWQLGGPCESYNPYLSYWSAKAPLRARGGITAGASIGYIRIDIVQHQLHAMLMLRRYVLNGQ